MSETNREAQPQQTDSFGDRPITGAAGDRLGRGPFVRALAEHLLRTPKDDSAVFALYGPWGTGKTSILNLVEERLRETKSVTVLRFNPWLFSGTDQLVSGFFRELAAQLAERGDEKLQKIASALEGLGTAMSGFGSIPVVGDFLKGGAALAGLAAKGAAKKGNALPQSLEAQRKQLVKVLREFEGRVVVLLDDIDRLRHEEIRDIMRLVRLVADLPRTVYLLAFDRVRVVEALSESGQSGQAYLEKIVQVALPTPEAAPPDLAKLLDEVVGEALAGVEHSPEDVQNVVSLVLRPLFRTARDIRRYANALPFVFSVVGEEVAAADILALEALRTIHPQVAEQLSAVRSLLTGYTNDSNRESERERAEFDRFIAGAGSDADAVRELCRLVFPASRRFIDNHHFGPERRPHWQKAGRVAHADVLSIYLGARLPEDVLPRPVVRAAAAGLGTAEWESHAALEPEQLENLLWRLRPYVNDLEPERALTAAVQISVLRPRLRTGTDHIGDLFGADTAFAGLMLALIKRATGEHERTTAHLERAMQQAPTLTAKCAFVALVGDHRTGQIGSKADAERLQGILGEEVANASAEQLAAEYFVDRLVAVAVTTGKLTPTALAELLTDDLLVSLLRAHVSESYLQTAGDAFSKREYQLAWPALCHVLPEPVLVERVTQLAAKAAPLDERASTALALAVSIAEKHRQPTVEAVAPTEESTDAAAVDEE